MKHKTAMTFHSFVFIIINKCEVNISHNCNNRHLNDKTYNRALYDFFLVVVNEFNFLTPAILVSAKISNWKYPPKENRKMFVYFVSLKSGDFNPQKRPVIR